VWSTCRFSRSSRRERQFDTPDLAVDLYNGSFIVGGIMDGVSVAVARACQVERLGAIQPCHHLIRSLLRGVRLQQAMVSTPKPRRTRWCCT